MQVVLATPGQVPTGVQSVVSTTTLRRPAGGVKTTVTTWSPGVAEKVRAIGEHVGSSPSVRTSPGVANGRSIVVWVARKVWVVPGMTLQTAYPSRAAKSNTARTAQPDRLGERRERPATGGCVPA